MIRLAAIIFFVSTAAVAGQPSMDPNAWLFEHSPGMPAHPYKTPRGWGFRFPTYIGPLPCRNDQACASVHYLTTDGRPSGSLIGAQSLEMRGTVSATKGAIWNYRTEPSNNGPGLPAGFRFMIQAQNDGCLCKDYGRWWSTDSVALKPGPFRLVAPLKPSHWSSVWGHRADSSPRALQGWRSALAHPARIGITFGGGKFYGHGVNVRGGKASMVVTKVRVNR